jgi:hypothetical protein
MGRVSRSRAASDVAATAASRWILAATVFRWILTTTASSRPSRSTSTTPPPPFGHGYWPPPPWAPPTGGHAPPWGMPPWTTLMPKPRRPSSSPPTVSHSCLHSIVPFVIRANVERFACSSIYGLKHPSSSTGRDFIDRVLNMGGSNEGEGGGTGNDAASPGSSCAICDVFVS